MLNGKRRGYLRGQANKLNPIVQIGKEGISQGLVEQTLKALEDHELVKGRVLNNSSVDAREAANELAEKCEAEVIQVIGNVFVLFKRNNENPVYILP
ncbi:MAG: ribosome assembly RNA-binding protein YhbY [Halanaerobiaceae bacterium]|jgi:RNA-binding protein|nr:ribosome assembly RNA-binding protein YhbY [Halanaerobiaceae bacterium]